VDFGCLYADGFNGESVLKDWAEFGFETYPCGLSYFHWR